MGQPVISHGDIVAFADSKINLHRDDVKAHREQVKRLRNSLTGYIDASPEFALVKMLNSGSVAKGTALSTINDMDVAVYVKVASAPKREADLILWLKERLQEAYSTLSDDQFEPQSHCVTISFRGSGLNVDIVPVLYEGDADDRGYLITKDTGDRVLTSIPLHLKFIRARKDAQPTHFAQVVRLVKWWARRQKAERDDFRFKSFMAELLVAHLLDNGIDLSDYPLSLEKFFAYIVMSQLKEQIIFTDYYAAATVGSRSSAPIEIVDPVNPVNNVAFRYTDLQRQIIVETAQDALDALDEAHFATSKGRAVSCWQDVLGPSFSAA